MKRVIKIFAVLFLACSILSGCSEQQIEDNHITEVDSEQTTENTFKTLDIDSEYIDNIVCSCDGKIVYSSYEDNDTLLVFYSYNLDEDRTYTLGKIENPYIDSGDIVIADEKIYLYCNSASSADSAEVVFTSSLYEIDLEMNEMTKLADDTLDQTLLYLSYADNNVISFKGNISESNSTTYLDTYDIEQGSGGEFEILISKNFDVETQTGEIIYNFAQYNEVLYVVVCTKDNSQISSWEIELYDLNGAQMGNISIDADTADLLNGDRISKFEVFDKYAFIRTFTGGGVLLDISSDIAEPKLLRDLDLDISTCVSYNDIENILLFCRDCGEVWNFSVETNALTEVNFSCETIRYIYIDRNGDMLMSYDKGTIYGNIDDFLTSE